VSELPDHDSRIEAAAGRRQKPLARTANKRRKSGLRPANGPPAGVPEFPRSI
jgi:hypothetical protein